MNNYAFNFDHCENEYFTECSMALDSNPECNSNPSKYSTEGEVSWGENTPPVWRDSIEYYTKLMGLLTHLTEEEEAELYPSAGKDIAARNAIVLNNIRLVLSKICNDGLETYRCGCADWEDYLQDSVVAMMEAASKYDYTQGKKYSTYAMKSVKNKISESIARNQPISIPKDISYAHHKVTVGRSKEENKGKPEADLINEILNADGKHQNLVRRYMEYRYIFERTYISMQTSSEDDNREFGDFIEDDHAEKPFHNYERDLLMCLFKNASLDDIERHVLADKYGVFGHPELKMKEIADRRGLSSDDEGRTIQQRGIRKLRKAAKKMNWDRNDLL